jgi:hypothetical protein
MTDRELLQQALDALNNYVGVVRSELNEHSWDTKIVDAGKPARETIEAIKARLAQPEPVTDWPLAPKTGYYNIDGKRVWLEAEEPFPETAPQKKEWVGLTDEEILEEYRQSYGDDGNLTDVYFARAIEAKLKEKNT